MSHAVDGLIGFMTHQKNYNQLPPIYGAPQYLQPYGGPSYYPLPTFQQPYPVAPRPPMGGPSLVPIMRPDFQPSSGSPSTSAYNLGTSENDSPSYMPYGSFPQNNPYFPFLGPPQLVYPPHGQPHADVNFVHPSPIQQLHTFEQLNATNLIHQQKNTKKKGKNRYNNNPGLGGNNPQQNHLTGGNQNHQGDNNNKRQGKNNNNLRTNFPYALCGEYRHYTHHCPQIVDFKQMKESISAPRPPTPPSP
jgi:hypothetical protein